ncbi:MAG: 2-(1,2-epoxy-1,2-dihydrophenyl)acetyl-CoA isomerase [Candidatus Lokiarchaeota archaeon]|nr:2-(1,2-epoxy-1,2-dihydrophenyl)acetyl-CoA isomerase [Candidatus Lokiarchaeota archaeon]MBD3342914.1 2-(1,2-epoxy-1,2-dihydrophenyl)acetyl-CoA isomerase [Candidatus Lokiarchaeota archaeon]
MTQYKTIILEINKEEQFATIYLNRPNRLNTLNTQLAEDFLSTIKIISNDNQIRSLIITGRGEAFCAGGDLIEFGQSTNPDFLYNLATTFHKAIRIMREMDAPIIAAINGICYGVGMSIACISDIRLCLDKAKFGVAFTSVGLSPDSSLTFFLPKIVGLPLANEMALINRVLNANEAKTHHLVSQIYTSSEELVEGSQNLARKISSGPTIALGSTKKLFVSSFAHNLRDHLDEELANLRKNSHSPDFREGVNAFVEKRKPNFKGNSGKN